MLYIALVSCFFLLLHDISAYRYSAVIRIIKFTCICAVCAFACGKLLSALSLCLTNDNGFMYNLLHSGNVYYGCFIGGAAGLCLCCRIWHIPLLYATDTMAAILPLGQAIGRIGCYLNGCCYGRVWQGFPAVSYVVNGIPATVFPAWFVEAFCCAAILLIIRKCLMRSRTGTRTAAYLLLYPFARFLIEFFRGDAVRGRLWILSTSQWISLVLFAAGLALLGTLRGRHPGQTKGSMKYEKNSRG